MTVPTYHHFPTPTRLVRSMEEQNLDPHRGVLILVLGIVGVTSCFITAPVALYLALQDIPKMKYGSMDPKGLGMTQAGLVCGILGTVMLCLYALWMGYFFYHWMTLFP